MYSLSQFLHDFLEYMVSKLEIRGRLIRVKRDLRKSSLERKKDVLAESERALENLLSPEQYLERKLQTRECIEIEIVDGGSEMMWINLPDRPFLRGETLNGSLHITSESPYIAKDITIAAFRKETYLFPSGGGFGPYKTYFSTDSVRDIVFNAKDMMIMPSESRIRFEYAIPEDVPFTFEGKASKIEWQIQAFVKVRIMPEKVLQNFVILPHVLKSENLQGDVPLVHQEFSDVTWGNRPFHLWRLSPFCKSTRIKMVLDNDHYSPGDTVSGGVYFPDDFINADVKVYSVFLNKSKHVLSILVDQNTAEEEQLITHVHDTFHKGSSFRFSFSIPDTCYPTFETKHSRARWMVRVVISRWFWFFKVLEKEFVVSPLVF